MEISILLLTFNHEKYIRQAVESILSQDIKVSYEVIIFDDASTDNTPSILKEYKNKFPNKIKLFLNKKNRYYPTKNIYFLFSKARGKYIAVIEGDDFWVNNQKIQVQYEFLESHSRYSACMTGVVVVDENGHILDEMNLYCKKRDNKYTFEDFRKLVMPGMGVSFFGRNYFDKKEFSIFYQASKNMGDITLYMLYILRGDIYQMDGKMAAYRYIRKEGETNYNSMQKDNLYKEYDIFKYWIKLENYVRKNHERNFKFSTKKYAFFNNISTYPIVSIKNLLKFMPNYERLKYWKLVFVRRMLMTSIYGIADRKISNLLEKHSDITQYRKNKKPLVLFGAGMVAQEYIDKLGWKDNILFCVDNNELKWGKSFKGYIINKPNEIIKYKDECKVLITNLQYEEEIAFQLESMGITNYFCWCYMLQKDKRNILVKNILNKGR